MAACTRCDRHATRRGLCPAHYEWVRKRQLAYGRWESLLVDAEPARAHVLALRAAGLGSRPVAEQSGVSRKTVQYLTAGRPERGWGPSRHISAKNAAAILAVPLPPVARHRATAPHQLVDATGTVRRLQALVAFGYSRAVIAEHLGMKQSNACHLFRATTERVLAVTARKAETVFQLLQHTAGPSDRARNEGRRSKWPLPLDWDEDDIDDPAASTVRSETARTLRAEMVEDIDARREQVAQWTRYGLSADDIAERLGVTARSVVRDRAAMRQQMAS